MISCIHVITNPMLANSIHVFLEMKKTIAIVSLYAKNPKLIKKTPIDPIGHAHNPIINKAKSNIS